MYWSHWKTPCTYKLCTLNQVNISPNYKWEDISFIQKETDFTHIRNASERIELALNPEIHPKRNVLMPLENALHTHTSYARILRWIQPRIINWRIRHSSKNNAFHTNTTCIWKDTTGIQPRHASKRKCSESTWKRFTHTIYARLMLWKQPQNRNWRIYHSYKRRLVSHKHDMHLKGYNWHLTPKYIQKENVLIPLENALHIQAMHV